MYRETICIGGNEHIITGRKRTKKGYVTLCIKTHPLAGKDGYVFEHRVIVEKSTGEYLSTKFDVHHKNGVKDDNRLENLEVLEHAEHTRITHRGLKRSRDTKRLLSIWAKDRLKDKRNHPEYRDIPKDEMIEFYRSHGAAKTAQKYQVTRRVIYNRLHEWGVEVNNAK